MDQKQLKKSLLYSNKTPRSSDKAGPRILTKHCTCTGPSPPRGTLMAAIAPAQGTSGRTRSSDPHGAVGVPEGRTARAERAQSLTSSGSQAPRARAGPIGSSENAEGIGRKGAGAGFIPLRGGCTRLCTRPGRGTVDGAGAARTALSQPSGSR